MCVCVCVCSEARDLEAQCALYTSRIASLQAETARVRGETRRADEALRASTTEFLHSVLDDVKAADARGNYDARIETMREDEAMMQKIVAARTMTLESRRAEEALLREKLVGLQSASRDRATENAALLRTVETHARTRRRLHAALETCRKEMYAEPKLRERREELERASTEVSERGLIYSTLRGAVDAEQRRLEALKARLVRVRAELSSLPQTPEAMVMGGQAVTPVVAAARSTPPPPPAPPAMVVVQSSTTPVRKPMSSTATTMMVGSGTQSMMSGVSIQPQRASRSTKRVTHAVRPSTASAPATDVRVDIFGGRRH